MKKGALFIVSIIIISCISSSCSSSKSLQELLQEEQKAIDRFITMNDFNIRPIKDYPTGIYDGITYYKTDDGLFFHVVDSGNGKRAQFPNEVCVRFDNYQYVEDAASGDTTKYLFPYPSQPFTFVYGISQTYSSSYFLCPAWVIPLSYVGENAVLDLIVPSTIGASNDYNAVTPMFYKNLRYTRIN